MPPLPPCRSLGRHCRELRLTLRIADLEDERPSERDSVATWLLGHRGRMSFGTPYEAEGALVVDVRLHVPCKYLREHADGGRCTAHGYRGRLPTVRVPKPPELRHGERRFTIVEDGELRVVELHSPHAHHRSLPVLAGSNPCATAPCRTADNQRGAACCRDLTLDVVAPLGEDRLELLLRARKSPYVCKVVRTDEVTIECEVISACHYLEHDGIHCGLHGLKRPDGNDAKPDICYEFPDTSDPELVGHPGCVFLDG